MADDTQTDVLIAGAGAAGLACALTLTRLRPQATVTLLDGAGQPGGSARWAVGSLTAAGTSLQRQAGVSDSPQAHYRQLLAMAGLPPAGSPAAGPGPDPAAASLARKRALLHLMCTRAPAIVDALPGLGITLAGPFPEPPHAAPRMHNVVPRASALTDRMSERLAATRAVTAFGPGALVTGLEAGPGGGIVAVTPDRRYHAGVLIVASGDASATHPAAAAVNPAATGTLMDLAAARLSAVWHRPRLYPGLRTTRPDRAFVAPGDDIVRRGVIRAASAGRAGELTAVTVAGRDFLAGQADYAGRDLYLDVPAAALAPDEPLGTYPGAGYATIGDYLAGGLARLERPDSAPAYRIGPLRVLITLADGGLDVDESMRVLRPDGAGHGALLACGSAALGDLRMAGHGHHLMWALVTGAAAARTAAAQLAAAGAAPPGG